MPVAATYAAIFSTQNSLEAFKSAARHCLRSYTSYWERQLWGLRVGSSLREGFKWTSFEFLQAFGWLGGGLRGWADAPLIRFAEGGCASVWLSGALQGMQAWTNLKFPFKPQQALHCRLILGPICEQHESRFVLFPHEVSKFWGF